jgi:hypothetical protein
LAHVQSNPSHPEITRRFRDGKLNGGDREDYLTYAAYSLKLHRYGQGRGFTCVLIGQSDVSVGLSNGAVLISGKVLIITGTVANLA